MEALPRWVMVGALVIRWVAFDREVSADARPESKRSNPANVACVRAVTGVLAGFTTIGVLIAVGALLAHFDIVDMAGQRALSLLAFYVASPALLLTVLARTDIDRVLSGTLVASAAAVIAVVISYLLVALLVLRHDTADTVIGSLCSGYVNAGNLGIPVAAYVLGDASLVAPILLMQLLVLQPLALTVMDVAVAPERLSWMSVVARPFRTPLTVGSGIGLLLSWTDTSLPPLIFDPLELLGAMAVPSMLIAYGVFLRLGPRPDFDRGAELIFVTVLSLLVQPLTAWAVGRYVLELDDGPLLAVTVLSALPTAQNVFVHATRYGRGVEFSRDAIFITTVLSVPVIAVIAAMLA